MKNFQTLNRTECREASIECFRHADSKYKDAIILANNGSYGNGISNLILCLEETMKGLILSLDADGFHFRTKVKGIKGLFENHKLRYFLGFVMSAINVLVEDLAIVIAKGRENPKKLIKQVKELKTNPKIIEKYFLKVMNRLQEEIEWFSELDAKRQSGMYVSYKGEIKSPNSVDKKDFDLFIHRIYIVRSSALLIAESYKKSVDELSPEIEEIHKTFSEEKYYTHLGDLIKIINDRKSNSFKDLYSSLEELKNEVLNNGNLLGNYEEE